MANEPIQIPTFTPRDYQLPLLNALDSGCKRAIACWARRHGKDVTALNYVVKSMVTNPGVYHYIFPSFAQGRKVIWDSMTNDGKSFLSYFPDQLIERKNANEMKIVFKNGSVFQIVGSNDYNNLMGTNPKGVVFSEYALQDPLAYQYIKPILAVNKGWCLMISTPRGKNHFYDLYRMAEKSPEWYAETITVEDTGILSVEDLDKERKDGMSEELIQQEFYCSFDMGIEGSFFGKNLDAARMSGRITNVPHDTSALVHSSWDLGISDSMSIILFQLIGQEIHIIDCYENNSEALSHYVDWLSTQRVEKKYNYGSHYFPHDCENRELSSGISRKNTLINLGVNPIILPTLKTKIMDGIDLARGMFNRIWFDDKNCSRLIKALENYRKEYDAKNNIYSDRPVHDWSSHFSDSFRYLSIACKLNSSSASSLSTDDLYRRNRENRRRI